MSFGKMNARIQLVAASHSTDAEGFDTAQDVTLASVRAYREDRHGNERWANMAAFSTASALFRFRTVPGVKIDTSLFILCDDERFRALSVENIRGRMYVEVLAEKLEQTVR